MYVSRFINVGGHEIHVTEWGSPQNPKLIMWHGLARTGRDFDTAARYFSDRFHVLCPDTLGRGLSGWSQNPDREYCFDFYEDIALALFEDYEIKQALYVGTSMGGTLGMRLASGPLKDRIKAMVVNDIAPELAQAAVDRILEYVSNPPTFSKIQELESYLKKIYIPFGPLSEQEWQIMRDSSARRLNGGQVTLHYDPQITRQFITHPHDFTIWDRFEKLKLPLLLIRGAQSDLFLKDWAKKMDMFGDHIHLIEIDGCGHAPALNTKEQIKHLDQFLKIYI